MAKQFLGRVNACAHSSLNATIAIFDVAISAEGALHPRATGATAVVGPLLPIADRSALAFGVDAAGRRRERKESLDGPW